MCLTFEAALCLKQHPMTERCIDNGNYVAKYWLICVLWHINLCGLLNAKSYIYIYIYIYVKVSKVGDRSRGRPEGSLFNSYYTEV